MLTDNNVLWYIDKTSCKVTWVGGTKSGIGKTFSGASWRNEVFQNVKTFTVIGSDRNLDCSTGSICNKSTHTGKLSYLIDTTTGTGISHHENRIIFIKSCFQGSCNIIGSLVPYVDYFLWFFFWWNITVVVLFCDNINFLVSLCKNILFLRRYRSVANGNGNRCLCWIFKSESLDFIKHFWGCSCTVNSYTSFNNIWKLFFTYEECNFKIKLLIGISSVNISQILWDTFVEYQTSYCTVDYLGNCFIADILCNSYLDCGMKWNVVFMICHKSFINVSENLAFALFSFLLHCQVIRAKYHILWRYGNRTTVGRF